MSVDLDHLLMCLLVITTALDFMCSQLLGNCNLYSIYFMAKTRIMGVGLIFHMITDWIDCVWIMYLVDELGKKSPYLQKSKNKLKSKNNNSLFQTLNN